MYACILPYLQDASETWEHRRLTAGVGSKVAAFVLIKSVFRSAPLHDDLAEQLYNAGKIRLIARSCAGLDWKSAIRNTVAVKQGSTISPGLWVGAEEVIALGSAQAQCRAQVLYQKWQPELGSSGDSLIEFHLAVYRCCRVTTGTLPRVSHCPGDWSPPLVQGVTSESAHLIWEKENVSWESGQRHPMLRIESRERP